MPHSLLSYTVAGSVGILVIALSRFFLFKRRNDLHTFPGPKRRFLLGNIPDFPKDGWSDKFEELRKEYGDIVYMELPPHNMLILSSLEDAEEMLGRRANIWSARFDNFLVNELMDFEWTVMQNQPGHAWGEMRKIFRKIIGPQSVATYDKLIELEAEDFVQKLRGFSGDPLSVIRESAGTALIKITYGEHVFETNGQALLKLNNETAELTTWALSQVWLVNLIPLTRLLPSWLPGISFHRVAVEGKKLVSESRNWAFGLAKEAHERGGDDLSIVSGYLDEPGFSAEDLRDATASIYLAGLDVIATALLTFFYSMLANPSVQAKIQNELDEIIGRGNIPNASAVQSLPYLNAAWKESLRLNPPAPTGLPHLNTVDDVWKGRALPKGTLLLCNIPFMLRDPRIWGDDGDKFRPERFLTPHNAEASSLPDVSAAFGFGRRICPGRYLAEKNGVIFVAAVLSTYNLVLPEGAPNMASVGFTRGPLRRPDGLQCQFVPRQ